MSFTRSSSAHQVLLTCQQLTWQVAEKRILNGVSFAVPTGSFIGLLGPNGAGKSSLLRCLYRYLKPSSGNIFFQDKNIIDIAANVYAQDVAVVLQESANQFNLSVYEVVALGLIPHQSFWQRASKNDQQRVHLAIAQVGMTAKTFQAFENLSGGEKQRVLIARAIVQQPKLLIMDEPTSHLDIKYQIQIMELAKSLGITVIASFHDLNLASAMSDEIIVLAKGEIVAQGSPEEVITETMLADVFGVCAKVTTHPQSEHHNIPHITYYYGYQTSVTSAKHFSAHAPSVQGHTAAEENHHD